MDKKQFFSKQNLKVSFANIDKDKKGYIDENDLLSLLEGKEVD